MNALRILLGISAVGVLATGTLAGAFLLKPGGDSDAANFTRETLLVGLRSAEAPQLSKAWDSLRSTGSAAASESEAMGKRWQNFTTDLKKIYPEAPQIADAAAAKAALQAASEWAAERIKAASESRTAGADQARDGVLAEISALRKDLEDLRKLRDTSLSARLKSLLVLGGDRNGPNGLSLIWIPDSSKGSAGGFWAGKRETSLVQYRDVAGREPASFFRKPSGGAVNDADVERMLQDARTKFLATAPAANRESAALTFDARMAPRLRAQYRAAAEQKAQQAGAGYDRLPTDLANMTEKDDSEPFLNKLQASDLPGSEWKYRLPTKAEWSLLSGKVDGIGTPDLSEWLTDSSTAVDRNWKSDQATSPPAPGTVGFRVVLSGPGQ